MSIQDIRYAARRLLRTPAFTIIAVLTLALGIGSTTAIFSVVNGVLLKPLPYRDPARLVRIASTTREGKPAAMSVPDFIDYRDQSRSFDAVAPMDAGNVNLTAPGVQPMRLVGARVGARFFDLLGVRPERGRAFAPGDDAAGAARVAVLSDELWRGRFGADLRVVGQSISIDGAPYTVVGVAPPRFRYPEKADLWVPMAWDPSETAAENRGMHSIYAIGRVRPEASVTSAGRELAVIASRLEQQFPESNTGFGGGVQPLQEQIVGNVRPALYALLGAVAFVLLIACTNIANLFLVRAASREMEMAVRTALGASRGAIVRQPLTESAILALFGAALGVLFAMWAVDVVVAFAPPGLPRLDEVAVDGRVLAFAAAVTLLTGILVGLAPALSAARSDISRLLRESGRTLSRGGAQRTRSALVITEMALAVVLLVGAGLLLRSFSRLTHVDPGFRPEHVVTFDLTMPDAKYQYDRDKRRLVSQLLDRLAQLPGTEGVAASFGRPMARLRMRTSMEIAGRPHSTPDSRMRTAVHTATPELFRTLGIPVVRGRVFAAEDDRPDGPQYVVINEELAKRYFQGENPIGRQITLGVTHDTAQSGTEVTAGGEIIGVVGNVKQSGLAEPVYPSTYIAFGTLPMNDVSIVVRSTADPSLVEREARAQVRALDADLPVYALSTMEDVVGESVAQPRFYTVLLGMFACIALLLASVGVYGVVSYAVSLRTRELGIRMALGASGARVVRLVLAQGLALTVGGILIGLIAATGLSRLINGLLFGVGAVDPATYAGVCVVLLGVALLASYIPARRAARVDPVVTMRAE